MCTCRHTNPPIHKHARTCVHTHTHTHTHTSLCPSCCMLFNDTSIARITKHQWRTKEQAWITGGMILTGENWSIWRKTCPTATLTSTNPTNTGLGQNPGLCSQRLPRLTYTKLNYHDVIMVTNSDCQLTCVKEEQSQQCVARRELTLRCNSPGSHTWHGSICSHDDFPP